MLQQNGGSEVVVDLRRKVMALGEIVPSDVVDDGHIVINGALQKLGLRPCEIGDTIVPFDSFEAGLERLID